MSDTASNSGSDSGLPADIEAMSFEDALAELEQIVRRLEAGQVRLDEAIQCYERGAQLKRHCEKSSTRRSSGSIASSSVPRGLSVQSQ